MAVRSYLIFQLSQLSVSAGQPDFRSNDGSNFNFDCRNGFLGIDYIGLDTSQSKIDGFCQGGGRTHPRGVGRRGVELESER